VNNLNLDDSINWTRYVRYHRSFCFSSISFVSAQFCLLVASFFEFDGKFEQDRSLPFLKKKKKKKRNLIFKAVKTEIKRQTHDAKWWTWRGSLFPLERDIFLGREALPGSENVVVWHFNGGYQWALYNSRREDYVSAAVGHSGMRQSWETGWGAELPMSESQLLSSVGRASERTSSRSHSFSAWLAWPLINRRRLLVSRSN